MKHFMFKIKRSFRVAVKSWNHPVEDHCIRCSRCHLLNFYSGWSFECWNCGLTNEVGPL